MHKSISRLCVPVLLGAASASLAQVPVNIGLEAELDACLGMGTIRQASPLYKAPNTQAAIAQMLSAGTRVFLCDERANGQWQGVVVPRRPKQDCGVSRPKPKQAYRGACAAGWIPLEHVAME